ncbi:ABC transporter permease [Nonomuraea sp. NPDC048916]|uniref:ABC transporter permease n=1 Tax=Nonomuraea sp. NPDC048916 TaxID=3154232 RepID=UPI0033EABCCF
MNARLVLGLVRHETVSFFRAPIAAVFTIALPMMMMVILGAGVGNAVIEARSGVRVMQFVIPVLAVFGIAQACFGALAIHLADLRDRGYLKRLRGTPVPAWAVVSGLAGAALVVSLVTVVLLLGTGMIFYDLRLVGRTLAALALTLLVGAACFTALGFALVALVRGTAVQMVGTGLLVALAFVSDIFLQDAPLPRWLDVIGWIFPLRHFANAVGDDLNPFLTGAGFHGDHLAVLAAWGIAGAAVALWRFEWEPRPEWLAAARARRTRRTRPTGLTRPVQPTGPTGPTGPLRTSQAAGPVPSARPEPSAGRLEPPGGRPTAVRLVRAQVAHALSRLRRDPATAFFTAILPVLILVLISLVFGDVRMQGVRLAQFMIASMITYVIGIAGYVNLAESISTDKDRGIVKRLAGTPLPRWAYYTGVAATGLCVTLAASVVLVAVAVFGFGAEVRPGMLPGALVAIVLGVACFSVLGALVATLVSKGVTANAITLSTFLLLAFVSEVFVVGGTLPAGLRTIGDLFPVKHTALALLAALDPAGRPWPWTDLAVLAGWTVAGVLAIAVVTRWRNATR